MLAIAPLKWNKVGTNGTTRKQERRGEKRFLVRPNTAPAPFRPGTQFLSLLGAQWFM